MNSNWGIHNYEILQEEDTSQLMEQQTGFLGPVEQLNFHWMSEPTFTQTLENEMGRCEICNGNHPSDQCLYFSGWPNYQTEEPAYFPEPYFSSLPPSTFDLQQPEPSDEDQILNMLNNWFTEQETQFQSQAESIQRITNQVRQLTGNANCISHNTNEVFNDENLSTGEAEQYQEAEISIQEPEPEQSRFDFYYSDSDEEETAELFVQTKVEDEFLYPQNEDLGTCFGNLFEEDLPEPITQKACISQMTDEELNAEIMKYICEETMEQDAGEMKDFRHSGKTSLFLGVQIKGITQKLDKMELPFKVKHHTRPPDFLSEILGAAKIKKEAQAVNVIKFSLPLYRWKRPFKSNAHGVVFNRTTKTTLKPP